MVEDGLVQKLQNQNKIKLERILEMQLRPNLAQVEKAMDVRRTGSHCPSPQWRHQKLHLASASQFDGNTWSRTSLVIQVAKNPPSDAGDSGSIPGQGTKIPHAAGQLSPCAATTEHVCRNYRTHAMPSSRNKRFCVPQLRPNTTRNK